MTTQSDHCIHTQIVQRTLTLATTKEHDLFEGWRNKDSTAKKGDCARKQLSQRNQWNDEKFDESETRIAKWRIKLCKTPRQFKTKHLRRRKPWRQKFNTACAAVADEGVT
jgi:hypothetical protein